MAAVQCYTAIYRLSRDVSAAVAPHACPDFNSPPSLCHLNVHLHNVTTFVEVFIVLFELSCDIHVPIIFAQLCFVGQNIKFILVLLEWWIQTIGNTVEPLNKGHFGNNINSAVVSFVERLSSSRRFKMY